MILLCFKADVVFLDSALVSGTQTEEWATKLEGHDGMVRVWCTGEQRCEVYSFGPGDDEEKQRDDAMSFRISILLV